MEDRNVPIGGGSSPTDKTLAKLPRRALLLGAATICFGSGAAAASSHPHLGIGMNLAGAEFGTRMPGGHGTDYIWPHNASADYYLDRGVTVIRVPFRWERLERHPGAGFVGEDIGHLDRLVHHITGRGAWVVLNLHNFGRWDRDGHREVIGEAGPATLDHFAGLWSRLAKRYRDMPRVVYGLMNEPHDQDTPTLVHGLNKAIAAIRNTGAAQLILATGNHYSGAHSWVSSGNAAAMLAITDPANCLAFDIHQYLDPNSSGVTNDCVPGAGSSRLWPFTNWAREHGRRGFLGEYNSGADAPCLTEMAALLNHLDTTPDIWLGSAYWAGGPWWGGTPFDIEPADLSNPVDRPQMAMLANRARGAVLQGSAGRTQ